MKRDNVCDVAQKTYDEFGSNTSIHGIKHTTKGFLINRIIWLLIAMVGLVLAINIVLLLLDKHSTNPTKTYIETFYAPISEIPFPAVTFCSNNQVMPSKVKIFAEKMNLYDRTMEEVVEALPLLMTMIRGEDYSNNPKNIRWLRMLLLKNDYTEFEAYNEITQTCEEMLVRCMWDGTIMDCAKIFREQYNGLGRCCTFNWDLMKPEEEMLHSKKFGVHMGLKVVTTQTLQDVRYKYFNSHGFSIIVHFSADFPSSADLYNIVTYKNIQFLHISVTTNENTPEVDKLSKEVRQCTLQNETTTEYFPDYSFNNCQVSCEIRRFMEQCHCVPFAYNSTGLELCDLTKLTCLHTVANSDARCYCPLECTELRYVIFSAGVFLDDDIHAASHLLDGINVTTASLTNVFFGGEHYTRMKRAIGSNNLLTLSSIGGIFSLILGCSFISMAEIIYYITIRFIIYLKVISRIDIKRNNARFNSPTPPPLYTTFYH